MNVHGGIDTPNTSLLGFISLMDRVSDRNSFFMPGADTVPMHGNNRHNGYFLIKLRVNQGHLITSWREWRLWTYFTPHLHRRGRRFESCSAHLCTPRDGGFFFHVPIYGRLVVRCLVLGYFRVQPCATAVMFLLRFVASRPQQA